MAEVYDRNASEVYAAGSQLGGDVARLTILVATLIAERIVEERRQRYEAAQRQAETRAAQMAERVRAERSAVQPVLSGVHQERFWRDADPRRIGQAWQAASEWAASDPYAAYTLDVLRENLRDRFGIETPEWPVGGGELSRILSVADPEFRQVLKEARTAAEAEREASYAVIIRDLNDPARVVSRSEMRVPAGMPVDAAAGRAYAEWARSADGAESANSHDRYAVELVENTGASRAAHVPSAVLRGDRAEEVLADAESWRQAVVAGTESASDTELLYALSVELDTLAEEEDRRLSRRADYAARLESDGVDGQTRTRLAGNVAAIDEGLPGLRQQQADTALRLAVTTATLRGENPQHVLDAAGLRENLDAEWWDTASAAEIAGTWQYVGGWQEGRARDEAHEFLRESLAEHHGLTVPQNIDPDGIAALFGGRQAPGPAMRIEAQGEALRAQAQALFTESYDAFGEAARLNTNADRFPEGHPQRTRYEQQASTLVAEAMAVGGQGLALHDQGLWLSGQDAGVRAQAFQGRGAQVTQNLADEYQSRWGQPLHREAREQLAAVAQEVAADAQAWQVLATPGSTDPAAGVIPSTASVSPASIVRPEPAPVARRVSLRAFTAECRRYRTGERTLPPGSDVYTAVWEELGQPKSPRQAGTGEDAERDAGDADGTAVHGAGEEPREAEADPNEGRRQAAEAALEAMSDTEVAEAVRVAAQAFPEGAEAATAAPAGRGSRSAGNGHEAGRERGSDIER
ncbi:hypothetical protein OG858_47395 (plasmid) [Streptomyces europaeiscabiei]|uniref:hypothetical protein n=1 Tax=Streptomyces europaeiscabiei TaxID=146819 RepID=UPI002E812E2A|nr:hypothetical protein [Streptomyces europaeiscabiei]WUD38825.1 hypothetical protein OG858_47395 [Streptomyces europaeiscabiei]